jgi:tRNA A-37 threonylcarbamoyl transferase component Bud32
MKVRRSIKCVIEPCRFRGRDAVQKRLARRDAPWLFYMRREIAVYRAFAGLDLPVRVPRMLDADLAKGVIVMERIDGPPVASRRHAVPQDRPTWEAMIAIARAIRGIVCSVDVEPTQADRVAMRTRLLEDPTAPLEWISSGLMACAGKGLIAREIARRLARAVKRPTFQHGDLLLRNVVREGEHLVVVDWECAGPHAEGWDAALLSVFAPEWARVELARGLDPQSFRACFVFALLREIVFRRGKEDEILGRLEKDLASALAD